MSITTILFLTLGVIILIGAIVIAIMRGVNKSLKADIDNLDNLLKEKSATIEALNRNITIANNTIAQLKANSQAKEEKHEEIDQTNDNDIANTLNNIMRNNS